MRFEKIKIHGIGPFNDAELDLTTIPPGVVAVTGANGAGKSTLCELFAGAGYRTTATHGDLAGIARSRDAYVEVVVANGSRYRIRHSVDATSRKGESVAFDEAGHPVPETKSAKVSAFDGWAAKHFADPAVYYAGPFAAQLDEGLIAMSKTDRMEVILKASGCHRYEAMAKQCRERAAKASASLETIVARIADEQARGMDVATAQTELDAARAAEGNADAALASAKHDLECKRREHDRLIRLQQDAEETRARRAGIQKRLDDAQRKLQELTARAEGARALVGEGETIRAAIHRLTILALQVSDAQATQARVQAEADAAKREQEQHEQAAKAAGARATEARRRSDDRRGTLSSKLTSSRSKVADLEARIRNNRSLLERADEIRMAIAEDQKLGAETAKLEAELAQASRDLLQAEKDCAAHERSKVDAFARETKAKQRLESRGKIGAAVASLPELRANVEINDTALHTAEADQEQLRGRTVAGAEERISGLRGGLSSIVRIERSLEDLPGLAAETLERDDAAVRDETELPLRLARAATNVQNARRALDVARDQLATAERVAARAGEMQQAEEEAAAASHARQTEELAVQQSKACAEQSRPVITRCESRIAQIYQERKALDRLVAHADKLAVADARISELEPQLEGARAELQQAEAAITSLPEVDPDVQAADLAVSEAAAKATAASERVALARTELDRLAGMLRDLAFEHGRLQPITMKLDELVKAEALASDLQSQVTTAGAEKASIEAELATVPDPGAIVLPDTSLQEAAVRGAEAEARRTQASVAVAESKLQAASERQAKLDALEAERSAIETALADWNLLAESLGRTGLQAALVDAAGPELTELTNGLLRHCGCARWTARWETKRMDADGKRELEDCDLKILDTVDGRDASGKSYSPGQRALMELAASLAFTQYQCRKLDLPPPTIVRDESSSGLSPEASRAYVDMLKKAAKYIGCEHVLFITHNPEMWDMADSRIVIENGSIRTAA